MQPRGASRSLKIQDRLRMWLITLPSQNGGGDEEEDGKKPAQCLGGACTSTKLPLGRVIL